MPGCWFCRRVGRLAERLFNIIPLITDSGGGLNEMGSGVGGVTKERLKRRLPGGYAVASGQLFYKDYYVT